jgi:hypothetical protein
LVQPEEIGRVVLFLDGGEAGMAPPWASRTRSSPGARRAAPTPAPLSSANRGLPVKYRLCFIAAGKARIVS